AHIGSSVLLARDAYRWCGESGIPQAIRMRSAERAGRLVLASLLDSPLEGDGFQPSVPRQIRSVFETANPSPIRFDCLATQEPTVRIHLPPAGSHLRT